MHKNRVIVGRAENIDLLGLDMGVPAKIDTGAYRSAIHISDVKVIKRDGHEVLQVSLLGHPAAPVARTFETDDFAIRMVRNSTGDITERYEIKLKIKLGTKLFTTPFTLINRQNNVFPVLIGRKALANRFMVDVTVSSVDRKALLSLIQNTTSINTEDLE